MKKFLSLILAGIVLLSCCIGTQAALPETLVPLWDNIGSISNIISVNGNEGTAEVTITGKSGTTKISATLTVYKQVGDDWVYVDSDSDSVNSRILNLKVDFTGVANVNYKSVVNISVTRNGIVETTTDTAYES